MLPLSQLGSSSLPPRARFLGLHTHSPSPFLLGRAGTGHCPGHRPHGSVPMPFPVRCARPPCAAPSFWVCSGCSEHHTGQYPAQSPRRGSGVPLGPVPQSKVCSPVCTVCWMCLEFPSHLHHGSCPGRGSWAPWLAALHTSLLSPLPGGQEVRTASATALVLFAQQGFVLGTPRAWLLPTRAACPRALGSWAPWHSRLSSL